jgi:hypothetical protein
MALMGSGVSSLTCIRYSAMPKEKRIEACHRGSTIAVFLSLTAETAVDKPSIMHFVALIDFLRLHRRHLRHASSEYNSIAPF